VGGADLRPHFRVVERSSFQLILSAYSPPSVAFERVEARLTESAVADVGGGQVRETGTHTCSPQQLCSIQTSSASHSTAPLGHGVRSAQGVSPGTQMPPPSTMLPHTQPGVSLQLVNVSHVSPSHWGEGLSVHLLSMQTCANGHSSLTSQQLGIGVCTQPPWAGSQVSVVQTSWSSQTTAVVPHWPFWQTAVVQASSPQTLPQEPQLLTSVRRSTPTVSPCARCADEADALTCRKTNGFVAEPVRWQMPTLAARAPPDRRTPTTPRRPPKAPTESFPSTSRRDVDRANARVMSSKRSPSMPMLPFTVLPGPLMSARATTHKATICRIGHAVYHPDAPWDMGHTGYSPPGLTLRQQRQCIGLRAGVGGDHRIQGKAEGCVRCVALMYQLGNAERRERGIALTSQRDVWLKVRLCEGAEWRG
jgi:hypothetical protein